MISRRSILAAPALVAAASAIPASPLLARAPLAGASSPPVYRFKVGAFEVTAIADGTLALEAGLFPRAGEDKAAADRLLAAAGLAAGPIPTFVNTYLINTGDRLVLIDTGTATAMGPALGKLPAHLRAAGIDPATIDVVALTHLHPDHANGLAPDGKPAFPNAEIVVTEAEHAFWTDEGIMSRAPKDVQVFFQAAQAAVKPYAARTRRIVSGEVVPGIVAEPAPGHTPGHVMYRVASGPEQLLVFGDIVHVAAFQFAKPEWSLAFDSDQAAARETRKRVFDMVSADRIPVAGMHLAFPGIGRVMRAGEAYSFMPQLWAS